MPSDDDRAAVPLAELEQLADEWADYHDGSTGNAVIAFKHCEQDLRMLMTDHRCGLGGSDE